ncbi:MAG: hypothetical protein LBB15_02825, partial [Puniceicoccales bacterium]|nr:hypothetical protein [Puniceicoccales bacterium]
IRKLWQTNLDGHSFAALDEEGNFYAPEGMAGRKIRAGISQERIYMCSGVLLIDCKCFEEMKIFERILEFVKMRKDPLPCPEQDAMNICLAADEHLPLNPRFNFTPFAPLAKRRLREIKKPIIVHFSWGKPWCLNRKIVNYAYKFGLFRYSFGFIKKYWEYADKAGCRTLTSERKIPTYYFMYKCTFGKIEHFVAKKIRNGLIRCWRKIIKKNRIQNSER